MGPTSELGPVDPQVANSSGQWFSVFNIVKSYEDLFNGAVSEQGNLQPYLQQLANYDASQIQEFRSAIELSHDVAVRALKSGMLRDETEERIANMIKTFLTPEQTKAHGRPIYRDEASKCGINIRRIEITDPVWALVYELYLRSNNYVMTRASKCVESATHSYAAAIPTLPQETA
jgi:hypothetical protein